MAKIRGKHVMVFLSGTTIALATSHELDISPKYDETKTKDDADGDVAEWDYSDWTMRIESLMGSSGRVTESGGEKLYSDLMALQLAGTLVTCAFDSIDPGEAASDGGVASTGYGGAVGSGYGMSGDGYISQVSHKGGADGYATISVTITGAGALEPIG